MVPSGRISMAQEERRESASRSEAIRARYSSPFSLTVQEGRDVRR